MREDVRDWLLLGGKSILFIVGGLMMTAALLQLAVGGPWLVRGDTALQTFEKSAGLVLLAGAALALPPLAFAFRDAYRQARKGRMGEP